MLFLQAISSKLPGCTCLNCDEMDALGNGEAGGTHWAVTAAVRSRAGILPDRIFRM